MIHLTPIKFYDIDAAASSSSTDKELTPMQEHIKWLELTLANEYLSRDNKRGIEIAIEDGIKRLEAERKMAALIYKDGCIEGLSAFDNPLKFFDDYFNSKYKQ